jgi:hypothetical protein
MEIGSPTPASADKDAAALRWTTRAVVALHLVLLLAALPHFRASVDSAYHTAMGRQFGIHGICLWDNVHYAPAHRPHLQGPAVHLAIGMLGRLLGGDGDAYVNANATLGVLCWLTAVGTTIYFARRLSGDLAALLATVVLIGGVNSGVSLSMNLPVFWMFLATGWAIHFFLEKRVVWTILCASLACYTHLGGFATVPVGLVVATLCRTDAATSFQKLRDLVLVGLGLIMVTSPYWLHVLRSLSWYVGAKGDTAWWIDPLTDLFWLVGLACALRAPRRNAFLLAWAAAPLVWVVQDCSRFILVSALPGALLGSIVLADWLNHWQHDRARRIAIAALVYVATVFPLGIPSLAGEILWLVKPFPILLDWDEMRADAAVIRDHHLNDKILQGYTSYVPSSISVYADIEAEKGHWVEVQPADDPSERMSVADKTYVVAIPPDDPQLAAWQQRGWIKCFGGGRWSSVLQFIDPPTLSQAAGARQETFITEAAWLSEHAEHNTMGNFFAIVFDQQELPRRRAAREESRARVTRMQLAQLLYAWSLEPSDPVLAQQARDDARALGWIAALQGDEMAMDYRSAASHAQFRQDLANLSTNPASIDKSLHILLENSLGAARGGLFSSKSRP